MNSAPVTLPCKSSTTATGAWPASATPVRATTPIMAERKRFIVRTSVNLPIIRNSRPHGDILYPAGELASKLHHERESYHTSRRLLTPVLNKAAASRDRLVHAGRHQPAGTITTPLSLGQRMRQAKLTSLASPGLTSNAHSSTPRLSCRLVVVGGVDEASCSTAISSFSLTGN